MISSDFSWRLKAAVYCASATEQEGALKQSRLRKLAERLGFDIHAEYLDVVSDEIQVRPAWGDLMIDAKNWEFSVVIVANTKHISPSFGDLSHIFRQLWEYRVHLIIENLGIVDFYGSFGRSFLKFMDYLGGINDPSR